MARKLTLTPDPTFKLKVGIPVPGKGAAPVEFTFKYRDKDKMAEWLESLSSYENDGAMVLDIATGWDLAEPFDAENIEKLEKTYPGSVRAITDAYARESTGGLVRLGN